MIRYTLEHKKLVEELTGELRRDQQTFRRYKKSLKKIQAISKERMFYSRKDIEHLYQWIHIVGQELQDYKIRVEGLISTLPEKPYK